MIIASLNLEIDASAIYLIVTGYHNKQRDAVHFSPFEYPRMAPRTSGQGAAMVLAELGEASVLGNRSVLRFSVELTPECRRHVVFGF